MLVGIHSPNLSPNISKSIVGQFSTEGVFNPVRAILAFGFLGQAISGYPKPSRTHVVGEPSITILLRSQGHTCITE